MGQRSQEKMTKSRGIRRKKFPRLNAIELESFRLDPNLEQKRKIRTYIVCRECSARRQYLDKTHFAEHGLDKDRYREKWRVGEDVPPLYAPAWRRRANKQAHRWSMSNLKKRRDIVKRSQRKRSVKIKKYRHDKRHANLPAARKAEKDYQHGRRVDPITGPMERKADRTLYRKKRMLRASAVEVEAFLGDPFGLDYVVCLEPDALEPEKPCHAKLRDLTCAHLPKIHGLRPDEYAEKHPGAPMSKLDAMPAKPSSLQTNKSGKSKRQRGRKGELSEETRARITVTAFLKLGAKKDSQIAPKLYPLHDTQAAAKNAAKNSIFKPHKHLIALEQKRLSMLTDTERIAQFKIAIGKIPGTRLPLGS
jgi:predicted transcriptional regulator